MNDGYLNGTRGIHIVVHKFFKQQDEARDEKGKPTGEFVLRDYVTYGQAHLAGRQETTARVDRVLSAKPPHPTSRNITQQLAWDRAEYIRPLYEAWKKGEELPDGGIPLVLCNFISADELDILKQNNIKSVQDLANCHDNLLGRIPLPAMAQKRKLAISFMNAQDANKLVTQMNQRDIEIEELKRKVAMLASRTNDGTEGAYQPDEPDKPRRSRPPKVSREAETEHEVA